MSASPGQPGALGSYPCSVNSSIHGAHAVEWIHRPWMKTTGVLDMMQLLDLGDLVLAGLEVFGQAAVDEEVGAGDVACSVTREQENKVCDLFGFGEAAG